MKKIILFIFTTIVTLASFAQGEFGGAVLGGGEFKIATFGKLCKNIKKEKDRNACSQDQLTEYIAILKTPEVVQKKKMDVSVIVNFGLDRTGKVIDVKIKKSSGNSAIDEICLKHINAMPNWTPEINDDQIVASSNFNITFKFKYKKKEK